MFGKLKQEYNLDENGYNLSYFIVRLTYEQTGSDILAALHPFHL